MKIQRLVFFVCLIFCFNIAKSQTTPCSSSCLGQLYGVSCDLNSDPVDHGYLVYTFPTPSYGINPLSVSGPGQPYIEVNGSTFNLYVRRKPLLIDLDVMDVESIVIPYEIETTTSGSFYDVNGHNYTANYHFHLALYVQM